MAVKEDYEACENAWFDWIQKVGDCKRIVGCSCNDKQLAILNTMFPSAKVHNTDLKTWNLLHPIVSSADIVVACNVFHYSREPATWISNVLSSCRYFWMQDVFMRQRGPDGSELKEDGDAMRYTLGLKKLPNFEHPYDLNIYGDRLLDYKLYDAGSMRERKTCINFVACFRGDLP